MSTVETVFQSLTPLGNPWVFWPLALILFAIVLWRLRGWFDTATTRLQNWFTIPKNQRIATAAALSPILLIWAWLLVEALSEVWVLTSGIPQEGAGKDIADANRNRVQAIFFGVGLIGALLAAIVVPVRLWLQFRQTDTVEQGHITDRLTKAIEQLGAEKTVRQLYRNSDGNPHLDQHDVPIMRETTEPNLEVRLSAIYALERIAQDSERDHITVMETLCAYIRENATASDAEDHDLGDWPDWLVNAEDEEHQAREALLDRRSGSLYAWTNALPAPRVDVQAALTVIGRRSDERVEFERRQERPFALDLRRTNLQTADLSFAKLDHALLTHARMEQAKFHSADLRSAALTDTCADTSVRAVDLRSVSVSQEMLNNLFGDTATKLPDGLTLPDHWDTETIAPYARDPKFEAWLAGRRASRTS